MLAHNEAGDAVMAHAESSSGSGGGSSRTSRRLIDASVNVTFMLIAWQVISIIFAASGLCSETLYDEGFSYPAIQSLSNYVCMLVIWAPVSLILKALKIEVSSANDDRTSLVIPDAIEFDQRVISGVPFWLMKPTVFVILAILDFESLYCFTYAYQFTSMVSIQVLDAFTLPTVIVLSMVFLGTVFKARQMFGFFICICGIGIFAYADSMYGSEDEASDYVLGDCLALLGAVLQATGSVIEDHYCHRMKEIQGRNFKRLPIMRDVCFWIAIWGIIFSTLQAWATGEFSDLYSNGFSASWSGYLIGFAIARAIFTSLVPLMLAYTSAAVMMISLLTSDFWVFVAAVAFYEFTYHNLYLMAILIIAAGIVLFCLEDMDVAGCWTRFTKKIKDCFVKDQPGVAIDAEAEAHHG